MSISAHDAVRQWLENGEPIPATKETEALAADSRFRLCECGCCYVLQLDYVRSLILSAMAHGDKPPE